MAIGVFGLKKIYKRQVDNIINNSFVAWSESSKYGYFGGGSVGAFLNTITRLDFSNETVSDPGKNFVAGRAYGAGVSNNSYGYFGGGFTTTTISTISRLDFSNETVSNPGNNLPTERGYVAGLTNSN
jgi:hypothetical protein